MLAKLYIEIKPIFSIMKDVKAFTENVIKKINKQIENNPDFFNTTLFNKNINNLFIKDYNQLTYKQKKISAAAIKIFINKYKSKSK